ncbi:MAG: helix-turn-helix domain-containing protein [Archangium sp.]|nr:helix-turn-helix domain-containing protein [Archangium sp.]
MERTELLAMPREGCPVAGALEIVGERWTVLIIREAFFGLRRFDEFQRAVGCARNLLTARLATLVEHGVMQKVPYRDEGQRERFEYRLTPKGHELYPVLQALRQWGDRWLYDGAGPLEVFHRECGGRVFAEVRCEHGHGPLAARETDAAPVKRGNRGRQRRVGGRSRS